MMTPVMVNGDCLAVLPTLAESSVDSIVTDPPYGLSFMGKFWDHGVPGVSFWEAALRVLKPAHYMLAFGGTRTYHRLACAIEDAGFEIRDCLLFMGAMPAVAWCYGSGFPKGKGCLKPGWESIISAQKPLTKPELFDSIVGGLSLLESQLCQLLPVSDVANASTVTQAASDGRRSSVRKPAVRRPDLSSDLSAQTDTSRFALAANICLSIVSSWKDTLAVACELPSTSTTETATRPTIDWKTLKCCLSALTPQCIIKAELQAPGSRLNALPAARYLNAACASINATQELSALESAISQGHISPLDGIGKGLKLEPILLARKPGPKVLPLQIDACRIECEPIRTIQGQSQSQQNGEIYSGVDGRNKKVFESHPSGRWPANVIHDGSEEVLAEFAKAGEKKAGVAVRRNGGGGKPGGGGRTTGSFPGGKDDDAGFGDSGSAARFFYCAKASKRDRNEGCEDLEAQPEAHNLSSNACGKCGLRIKANGSGRKCECGESRQTIQLSRQGNGHPTVKPTALLRYLCRLITPPGGTILDPFMGSGSTGKAARLEGFGFQGIEIDPGYFAIAQKRVLESESHDGRTGATKVPSPPDSACAWHALE